MIISKPKANTLFALAMFLLICYSLLAYTIYNLMHYSETFWFQYAILLTITPIALFVTFKTFQSFKIIYVGKGKLQVRYPLLRKRNSYAFKNLKLWKETVIKTGKGSFKELSLQVEGTEVKLTSQENSNYEAIKRYLNKKHPQKRVKN